jgi:solute:Na+ symporter, SSS family
MKTVTTLDYVVIAVYMALMLGIGVYAARFNKGASDYFKGGNRVPWLVAGLSSFMSGFSAWTFTGAAGLAYNRGLVAILIYVGNALCFLLGYWVFAVRWRRSRISTVMEYLNERFDERTRQAFSWCTVIFQLFTGATMLYGVGLFVATTCDLPLGWTILFAGIVTLASCVAGGLWAVVITDFLQAVILMPFTLVMFVVSLNRVGGPSALLAGLPPEMKTVSLLGDMGWMYIACWTVMVSFGYNTAAMAQRYFCVDDERSARKVALLCFWSFLLGALIWFVPPLAMRVLYPDLRALWPGLANPHEASYAVASLTLLPSGLVGIMLASMFSATISGLSGLFNMHGAVISKDIYQTLVRRTRTEKEMLVVAWIATFGVGSVMTALAVWMAASGQSIFKVMVTFNTIISLAYGPPALLGLVVKRTPAWSGLASFAVGLVLGCYGAFVGEWSLIRNVLIIIPATCGVFLLSRLLDGREPAHVARRDGLFLRLATPVDVERELAATVDHTSEVFRFLAWSSGGVGLASLALVFAAGPGERGTVVLYAALTLLCAVALVFVGRVRRVAPQVEVKVA